MKTLKELKEGFIQRAEQAGLTVECAMDGTIFSDKVIIAEAPGPTEVQRKLPLVGGSGSAMWRALLKYTGLSRKDFYVTNVSKRQVAFPKTGGAAQEKKVIKKDELALWTELLLWELSYLPNLRYILVMGNFALNAITGHSGINSWRGSVVTVPLRDATRGTMRLVTVICVNNPANIFHDPKSEVIFNYDIARVKKVLDGNHHPFDVTTTIYPSIGEIDRFVDNAVRSQDELGHDIESIGGQTACFGFADSSTTAMCIALRTKTDQVYTAQEEVHIYRQLQRLYSSGVPLICQNGAFDMTWELYKDKLRIPRLKFDTMLGHHTLYPLLPHDLGFLTTQYTDNPYYKDEIHKWKEGEDIDTFWEYNGKDCAYLHPIKKRIHEELETQGLSDFFYNHVMRLQEHLVEMTVGGILIDVSMKEALKEELQLKVSGLLKKFQEKAIEITGVEHYYNPNSPKQMTDLYFSKLKLVGRGTSTDKENRDRMFAHPRTSDDARELIQIVNEYAEEHKFYSTYAKTGIDDDNRMRCSWNQTGVKSAPGRLSSSATLWESGTNLQNQPDRAYPMFIADPGYGFSYFDRSQVEARYVGWYAKIDRWIEQFERARLQGGYDAHRALASDMFKVPYDQVPAFDRYDATKPGYEPPLGKKHGDVTIRYVAKRCRHGLNYRMGPDRLATTTGLPLSEAEYAYRVYHRETPELRRWWADLETELKTKGCLYNALGRRFILMEKQSPEALESIVAFKPQSTNGDAVGRMIYQCHEHPKWPRRTRIRLNVHDALIALGPLDERERALSIMKAYAEAPIIINGMELIVPADCKLSYADDTGVHRWSQLKAVEVEKELHI